MPTANLNTSVHSWTRKYTQTIMKFTHACIDACTCMDTHTYSHTYIHICLLLIPMIWNRQANFESKGDKLFSSAERRIRTQGLRHQIASRLNARWQTDWAIEDQAKKTWTRQSIPMISEHSAHSTPLPVVFRTWLSRYICLLLILMLWHRQAIFELKVDELSSSAECRIWTTDQRHQLVHAVCQTVRKYRMLSKTSRELGIPWVTLVYWSKQDVISRKKPCDAMASPTEREIRYFYLKPHISTSNPAKKHVRKDMKSRHTHNKTLKDTYNYFVLDNESKASFFKFSQRRPAKVLTVGQTNMRRCLCEKCINIEMQFKGLTRKAEKKQIKADYEANEITRCSQSSLPEMVLFNLWYRMTKRLPWRRSVHIWYKCSVV